jgi:flagellar secretion chaperone FliS
MAINLHAQTTYLRNKIENATPLGRIIILYEACLRFLRQSAQSLAKGDKISFVHNNIKAQNIVRELRNSLNMEIDEKVALGFFQIYSFVLKQLMGSVRQKSSAPINTAIRLMEELYSAWKTAEEKGLGKGIRNVEERSAKEEGRLVRTRVAAQEIASANVASSLGQGLNLMG